MYIVVMKSESSDTFYFTADRKLNDGELKNFIKEFLPHEYDEEEDDHFIFDIKFIEINSLTKIK